MTERGFAGPTAATDSGDIITSGSLGYVGFVPVDFIAAVASNDVWIGASCTVLVVIGAIAIVVVSGRAVTTDGAGAAVGLVVVGLVVLSPVVTGVWIGSAIWPKGLKL